MSESAFSPRFDGDVTFADWQEAARAGYIKGGMTPAAAAAIVADAADDVAPLVSVLTFEFRQTFLSALDLECGRYVRRNSVESFKARGIPTERE
jgi:hypothetical protein